MWLIFLKISATGFFYGVSARSIMLFIQIQSVYGVTLAAAVSNAMYGWLQHHGWWCYGWWSIRSVPIRANPMQSIDRQQRSYVCRAIWEVLFICFGFLVAVPEIGCRVSLEALAPTLKYALINVWHICYFISETDTATATAAATNSDQIHSVWIGLSFWIVVCRKRYSFIIDLFSSLPTFK